MGTGEEMMVQLTLPTRTKQHKIQKFMESSKLFSDPFKLNHMKLKILINHIFKNDVSSISKAYNKLIQMEISSILEKNIFPKISPNNYDRDCILIEMQSYACHFM